MTAGKPLLSLPSWEFRNDAVHGPSVWAQGRGIVAYAKSRREEDVINMRCIAALPRVLEELRATSSCLQAACLIMKDPESRKLAMQQVTQARQAIDMATGSEA
jgi:hypothetical protein